LAYGDSCDGVRLPGGWMLCSCTTFVLLLLLLLLLLLRFGV
jgi:hypothetical protein